MVSVLLFTYSFFITSLTRALWLRARNAVPETPSATPVSITQSLSSLRLEHAHLLEAHGADRATLRQREAELADVQAREVDARATADTLLQATRAAEDRAARAERTAALAEREVGFLKALNVRSLYVCFMSHLGPVMNRQAM
jgi:mitotic spindle assembly checkpoint protein MAD1